MKKFGQRGVVAITVVVVIAISAGAGAGAPVAVDVADVDPDHPLYALERIGERIRMVGDEDQMHERCKEGYLMYGKYGEEALRYDVFKEFVGKAEKLLADPATEEKVKAWLESEKHRVGIVTDLFDVDPDHPLYEFEIGGEHARGIENKKLAKERLGEFMKVLKKGHGIEYAEVMEEFREKWNELAVERPVDDAERKELLEWMKDQKDELTEIQIELAKELLERFKEEKIPPEVAELIKEKRERFEALIENIRAATTEEEREAALRELKKAILEQIERFKERIPPEILEAVEEGLHACDVSWDLGIDVKIEIEIGVPLDVEAEFGGKLSSLDELFGLYKSKMPEEVRKSIENLRKSAVKAGKTKMGLACLEKLEDELEAWKEIGEKAYEEYQEMYGQYTEKIEGFMEEFWEKIPEAIKLKIELIKEAVAEGDYEEAAATLQDLIREFMELKWEEFPGITPSKIAPEWWKGKE